jgi:hypothetical protein
VLSALIGGVLSVAVAGLLLLAPAAFALPPANDNFAEAKDFGSAFPLTTVFSNAEATEEAGDPRVTLSPPEHSVWFRWEAPSDGAVAVDTCRSEFATTLAVFTGSTLSGLTEIGADTNADGRYCADATGVGFHAVAGTVYSIMVAGNGFHFPEAPVPTTQGSFELRLAGIPLPPNDDFANPKPTGPSVTTFIDGAFTSYATWSDGFTWNATKESGEPNHAGDPGGASVWYEWTAPRSGPTEVGACASPNVLLGVYTGNAVNALTEVLLESRPMSCFVNFDATAGTVYRIAVDGKRNAGTGLPEMTSFGINVSMHPQPPPKAEAVTQPDTRPPDTKLFVHVLRREPPIYIFHFSSTESGSTFRCKLDKHRYAKCHSPKRFQHLKSGSHTLKVFAVDPAGNVDPSPAIAHFTFPSNVKAHSRH